jgi:hypothetical protein
MLRHDTSDLAENPCPDCGKPVFRRQIFATNPEFPNNPGIGRMVVYDTHSECLTDPAHHAALLRMDAFFTKLHGLIHAVMLMLPEQGEVPVEISPAVKAIAYQPADSTTDPPTPEVKAVEAAEAVTMVGRIKEIQLYHHKPSACAIRTHVLPEVVVESFGMPAVFVLSGNPNLPGPCHQPHHTTELETMMKTYPGFPLDSLTPDALLGMAKAASETVFRVQRRKYLQGDHRHGIPRASAHPLITL